MSCYGHPSPPFPQLSVCETTGQCFPLDLTQENRNDHAEMSTVIASSLTCWVRPVVSFPVVWRTGSKAVSTPGALHVFSRAILTSLHARGPGRRKAGGQPSLPGLAPLSPPTPLTLTKTLMSMIIDVVGVGVGGTWANRRRRGGLFIALMISKTLQDRGG